MSQWVFFSDHLISMTLGIIGGLKPLSFPTPWAHYMPGCERIFAGRKPGIYRTVSHNVIVFQHIPTLYYARNWSNGFAKGSPKKEKQFPKIPQVVDFPLQNKETSPTNPRNLFEGVSNWHLQGLHFISSNNQSWNDLARLALVTLVRTDKASMCEQKLSSISWLESRAVSSEHLQA